MSKRKAGPKFYLEHRQDGRWYPVATFKSKAEAEKYAAASWSCQNNGYQIKKGKS